MDVYTHFQHTFMVKQLVKWILHPMTPLSHKPSTVYKWKQSKTVLNKYVGRFRCERTTGSEIFHWYYYVRIMEWSFGQKWWGLKLTPHGWIFFLTNSFSFHKKLIDILKLSRLFVDYCFLSTVWNLILTAPIRCRWSIGEQDIIQNFSKSELMFWLYLGWSEGKYIFI